ncbi:MAG: hypothetical protein EOP45_10800 [Sphingobacteriaceae bacterium]|nr:MAG: hypothetical protein EOP45_10800 [Sphingobacteriaceae bacterium]
MSNLSFGKRLGFEPVEIPFQVQSLNSKTRVDLWNAHYIFIQKPIEGAAYSDKPLGRINKLSWIHFFNLPLDDYPQYESAVGNYAKRYITTADWYKIYEFFEFILDNISTAEFSKKRYHDFISSKLLENNSAYTLVNDRFVPVMNESEINEISRAQQLAKKYKLNGVQEHLNSAIELIAKKPSPDYRNSIKESISMVEAISRIIEPSENTLGKALNKLDKNQKINSTLKSAFEKLYAYTNDKNGIRHALMDEQLIDTEDARFFLISCSAFTNYLIEKAIKDDLLK